MYSHRKHADQLSVLLVIPHDAVQSIRSFIQSTCENRIIHIVETLLNLLLFEEMFCNWMPLNFNWKTFFFSFISVQRGQSRLQSLRSSPRRKRSEGRHEFTSQVQTKHMQMIVKRVTCNNYQVHSSEISFTNKKVNRWKVSPAWRNSEMKCSPMDWKLN